MRAVLSVLGFMAITGGLIWTGLSPKDRSKHANAPARTAEPEQVSRAEPIPLTLRPALPETDNTRPLRQIDPAPTEALRAAPVIEAHPSQIAPAPQAAPKIQNTTIATIRPVARPKATAAPRLSRPAALSPAPGANTPQEQDLRAIGHDIIRQLNQAPDGSLPGLAPRPSAALRTHPVAQGDSLAGIALRYFGSTAAYPRILEANRDLLGDPSDMRPGMVLKIPDN